MVLVYWIYHCVSFFPSFYLPLFLSFFFSVPYQWLLGYLHPSCSSSPSNFIVSFSNPVSRVWTLFACTIDRDGVSEHLCRFLIVSIRPLSARFAIVCHTYLRILLYIYIGWNSRLKLLFIPNLIILSSLSLSFAFSISLHTYLYPTSTSTCLTLLSNKMANQCSGHSFAIVQATNGNILTWRCSDCNSGPFVAIWRCKICGHCRCNSCHTAKA